MKTTRLVTILFILFLVGFLMGQLFQIYITSYELNRKTVEREKQRYLPKKCRTEKTTQATTTRQPNHDEIMIPRDDYDLIRPLFRFLKEPELNLNYTDNCLENKDVSWQMVFFIKSAAKNYVRRELLRRTWASVSYLNGAKFYTIFVVGNPPDGNKELLNEESERYKDILQFDGPDDYKNVVLKTLAGMQWSSSRLPSSIFYSSGDDDFLVDISLLKQLVDKNIKGLNYHEWPEFPIICSYKKLKYEKPNRVKKTKNWISKTDYKWTTFPKSCLGGLYTSDVRVIGQLFNVSKTSISIDLDDVWVTGLLRQKLGMPDEMVVTHELNIATHYNGYKGKKFESSREFMSEDWRKIYKQFGDNICHYK